MKLSKPLLVATALIASSAFAQESEIVEPVVEAASQINESAASSQRTINSITDEIDNKLQQFSRIKQRN